MRELKFRAWVNDHWTDFLPTCRTLSEYNACIIDTDGYTYEKDNPFIVEQYTGLKDKNGKEIYEGDILRFKGGSKSIVKFCEMKDSDCTYFYLGWASVQDGNEPMSLCEEAGFCEVIGNIHENPELLEEGE